MKARWLTMALCLFLLVGEAAYGQCSNDLIGVWHNELNATLSITAISPAGQLSGTYVSHAGNSGQIFPLNGWVNPVGSDQNKDRVVPVIFNVKWSVYGSITVWSGYLGKGKDGRLSITAIWNLVTAYADPDNAQDRNTINLSVFKPGPAH